MKCDKDKYIGFDLHQATTVVAVLDADGKVAMETIVASGGGNPVPEELEWTAA